MRPAALGGAAAAQQQPPAPQAVAAPATPAESPERVAPEVASAQAEASATAATAAAAATATAAAAPQAPEGAPPPADPDPDDVAPAPPPAWRVRRHRDLPRLRVGRHVADAASLDRLQLTAVSPGLRLGRDQAGEPVALPLFGPDPLRVVLLGASPATPALLAVRALRFGARLVVFTHDTGGWVALGRRVTGRTDRVSVLAPGETVHRTPSVDAPVLRLLLADPATGAPPASAPDLPGWSTELSVVSRLTPEQVDRVAAADVVLAGRLSPAETDRLRAARRLAASVAHRLEVLHDDMLAVVSPAGQRYAWIGPSRWEADLLADGPEDLGGGS